MLYVGRSFSINDVVKSYRETTVLKTLQLQLNKPTRIPYRYMDALTAVILHVTCLKRNFDKF